MKPIVVTKFFFFSAVQHLSEELEKDCPQTDSTPPSHPQNSGTSIGQGNPLYPHLWAPDLAKTSTPTAPSGIKCATLSPGLQSLQLLAADGTQTSFNRQPRDHTSDLLKQCHQHGTKFSNAQGHSVSSLLP